MSTFNQKHKDEEPIYQGILPEMTIIADKNTGLVYKSNTPYIKIKKPKSGKYYHQQGMLKFWKESPVSAPMLGLGMLSLPFIGLSGKVIDAFNVGKPFYTKLAKDALAGTAGAIAWDEGYKKSTGKDWGNAVSEILPERIPDSAKNTIGELSNPGGWVTFGIFRNNFFNKIPKIHKVSKIIKLSADDVPYPPQVKPNLTYPAYNLDKYNTPIIKLGTPTPQSLGKFSWIDLGEYDHPDWVEFYEAILKPLNENSILPSKKPRLAVISNESPNAKGFAVGSDIFVVDVNKGSKMTGIHEYVSHGTDNFANLSEWKDSYFIKDFTPKRNPASAYWYEQRATLNEARFILFNELKKKLGKTPTLQEFLDFISNLSDLDLIKSSLMRYPNFNKFHNGYALDYYDHLDANRDQIKDVTTRLRFRMKYAFGLAPFVKINKLKDATQ